MSMLQWRHACASLALLLGLSLGAAAQSLQPVPALSGHVVDLSDTLGASEHNALEERLQELERTRGSQVVLLLVPSTQPEDIASYANRVGNAWKIGRQGVGDGVLLVVAKNDRKVRIEVAKSLEGAIPDLAAQGIIDSAITPAFRQGQYAQGLQAAVSQISARIAGEALPAPKAGNQSGRPAVLQGFDWMDLAIFLFFAVPIGGAVARRLFGVKLGALLTGGGVGALALMITSSMLVAALAAFVALLFTLFSGANLPASSIGRSHRGGTGWGSGGGGTGYDGGFGSGGSSDSGGGFSSGGGGDFGGGGASGDW